MALEGNLIAEGRKRIVGTWRLVSASATTVDGRTINAPFGSRPTGVLIYTSEGKMTAIVSYSGRKPLSADRISSPPSERADAFATFFAYAGSYSIDGDKVIHHVEISSVENWVDTDMERMITFDGDEIRLTTPTLSVGGTIQKSVLVWERVR